MATNNHELEELVDSMVEKSLKKHLDEMLGMMSAEIKNENGNASIKQSGNGIVYVDNTGIAYAFILFYQYFMKEKIKDTDFDQMLDKLNNIVDDNRNSFKEVIEGMK
jgi:hypothetical protein